MPMHPAAPEDLHGLVEAFAGTAQAIVDLAFPLSDDDGAKTTACPGWTVKDQVSHVTAIEAHLLGRADPPVELPDYPHLRNDIGRLMEPGVEVRRAHPLKDVVAELQRVLAARLGRLRDPALTDDTPLPHPFTGVDTTLGALLRQRILDVWSHEQDIRESLGRPGNLDTPAAAVSVQQVLDMLPHIVVRRVGLEPGKVLMVELTGPVVARSGVRVDQGEPGEDGSPAEPVGRLMFAGASDETGPIPAIGRTTSLHMSTDVLMRRAAGRRATEDCVYTVLGDDDVARRFMDALAITP
ncbi:hypothetical protein KEM60_01350 [Austwickia sp. TVS 96-490-7B]|uniref:maleylpyruvate isomerase family mycothiol-dependent enzyme n=1 Tax=Austwickia sp. TVS 96-490-7B TaxID=2830843 RepID=UPI001C5862CF|nr:maleylpyruvate isomerase family mycothiol-dependent enzyme [Austwickia sp. TVS 96-490-7B]MBW3085153.1 hypothetical protein [Austwickia sp. TVS 96-490-7B]